MDETGSRLEGDDNSPRVPPTAPEDRPRLAMLPQQLGDISFSNHCVFKSS